MEDPDKLSTFEMNLRILGNEVLGLKIAVDDFKTKWLVLTILATGGIALLVTTFGEPVKQVFGIQ